MRKIFWSSHTVVGLFTICFGLIIGFLVNDFPLIQFDNKMKLYEILNLFLTISIAIIIPFVIKKTIDDNRAIKSFLSDEIKETLKELKAINDFIKSCYHNSTITRGDKDSIIRKFNELEIQINALNQQLEISFKSESSNLLKELKEIYFIYDRYVTGDELMCDSYQKLDDSFYRDYKTHYNKLHLHLKKLIHKIHNF